MTQATKESQTVQIPNQTVDSEQPTVELDQPLIPLDSVVVGVEELPYRHKQALLDAVSKPYIKDAIVATDGWWDYRIRDCTDGYYVHEENEQAALLNAVEMAHEAGSSTSVLQADNGQCFVCTLDHEIRYSSVRTSDAQGTQYDGLTILCKPDGPFVANSRIAFLTTIEGHLLAPVPYPDDTLPDRYFYWYAGDMRSSDDLARLLQSTVAASSADYVREPRPFEAHIRLLIRNEDTAQYSPCPEAIEVQLKGIDGRGRIVVVDTQTTKPDGLADFVVNDLGLSSQYTLELFFLVKLSGTVVDNTVWRDDWSSLSWQSDDSPSGRYSEEVSRSVGTQQTPLVYRLAQVPIEERWTWPLSFEAIQIIDFIPFAHLDGDSTKPSCRTSWRFDYGLPVDTGPSLLAVSNGLLTFDKDKLGHPSLVLSLNSFPIESIVERFPACPYWLGENLMIHYEGVDTDSVKEAVKELLLIDPTVRTFLEANHPECQSVSANTIAEWFVGESAEAMQVTLALPVFAGCPLGHGAFIDQTKRFVDLRISTTSSASFWMNPAYYMWALCESGHLDADLVPFADLRDKLVAPKGPLIANGFVRMLKASDRLNTAIEQEAQPGDMLLLTEPGPYLIDSEIKIDKPLVIKGFTPDGVQPVIKGGKPGQSVSRSDVAWSRSAFRIFQIHDLSAGVVQLLSLHFQNGAARQGGAIYVDEYESVWIEACTFTGNEAFAGGWLYEGFGGAICTRHAGIVIKNCVFESNRSNCRGGAVGVFGYGWPIITNCAFRNNRAEPLSVTNPFSGRPYSWRPDGGAVGIQMATPSCEASFLRISAVAYRFDGLGIVDVWSLFKQLQSQGFLQEEDKTFLQDLIIGNLDPYWDAAKVELSIKRSVFFQNNTFRHNYADDDGGGIYTTGLVRIRCIDLRVQDNCAGSNGGGIRISTASDLIVNGGIVTGNCSNFKRRGYFWDDRKNKWKWTDHAGGGIASRTSNCILYNVVIKENKAHRFAGGGIYFSSTDDGSLPISFGGLGTTWNTIRDFLVTDRTTGNPVAEFAAMDLRLTGCRIENNSCGWCDAKDAPRPGAVGVSPGRPDPPEDDEERDIRHAKGGGVYALRYKDSSTNYPPIQIWIAAGTVFRKNVARFAPTARELFIADLASSESQNNPIRDSRHLIRDADGVLTADLRYPTN